MTHYSTPPEVGAIVRLLQPFHDHRLAVVTGLDGHLATVAPYSKTYTCRGRVLTLHPHPSRLVDFLPKYLKATVPWPPRAL